MSGEMTLFEHLAELRNRLFKAALALALGTVVGYALFDQVFSYLVEPYCELPQALRTTPGEECQVAAFGVLDAFSVRIKTSLVIGLFVGGPVIFYQLWRFVAPGLSSREKRYAVPFVLGSQVLFGAGLLFAAYVIPRGLQVLLSMGGDQITPLLGAPQYLSFVLTTAIAFGAVFELPLILVFLSLAGVVTARGLRRFRPYAVVLSSVAAALITPTTDPVTMLAMMGPMVLFYEAAILAAWLIERGRRRREAGRHQS